MFHNEARAALKIGVDKLANSVKTTLGPKGRNVVIDRGYGSPVITKDGVTVAREIILKDKFENLGASLIKEAASKTNDTAGDGTTTATVLAQAMINEGIKNVTAGSDPLAIRRGIEKGVEAVIAFLKKNVAKPVVDADIEKVASISANDPEIGKVIAEAMLKIGKDGAVTVEESQTFGIQTEVVKGMRFDRGFLSPYMVTNTDRMEAEYENVRILVADKRISLISEIAPILEKLLAENQKDVVIIADTIEGEALTMLIMNKMRRILNVLAVQAPGFGSKRREMLKDIAILTGATLFSDELGMKVDDLDIKDLGVARRVVATADHTTIIEGAGVPSAIEERANQIRLELTTTDMEFDREKLRERIAKLVGGVGVIKVGAATEVEMREKKHRIEDAVAATKAALEEGIVPGGGVALLAALPCLKALDVEADERIGVDILSRAICEPVKCIAENAGKDGAVVIEKVMGLPLGEGYNAAKNTYENLVEAGIVDPMKVTRCALQNASSVASMFLTTECVVMEFPNKDES